MIDFGKILKRAWSILWSYRTLWIFGVLLALTMGGGSSGSNSNYRANNNQVNNGNGFDTRNAPAAIRELVNWFTNDVAPVFEHPSEHVATLVWLGVALFLFIVIVGVITSLIRYPSEVAVMRMVDGYEASGEKLGFRASWKLGWNRRAFRLWLIDLIIGLPALLFIGLMIVFGVIVFMNASGSQNGAAVGAMIASIGCIFLLVFAFIVLMVALGLMREFFARFAALEDTGVGESFRHGWAFFKQNWKSTLLMWLIMIAIGIGYAIAGVIIFVLLVPVYLILLIPAALIAAIPGLTAFGIASIFFSGPPVWLIGAFVALPFFFIVLFAPLVVVNGWFKVYSSSVWTLTYREMKALHAAAPAETPHVPAPTA
jgi:hypothetical protein